jgi:hypothetical protein
VIEALAAGSVPSIESLAHFVGRPAASWILARPAGAQTCADVRAHVKELGDDPAFPIAEFGTLYRLEEEWSAPACAERKLHPAARTCLLSAQSLTQLAACPEVAHPQAPATIEKLRGRWVGEERHPPDGTRRVVLTCSDGRVHIARGDESTDAVLELRFAYGGSQIKLPAPGGGSWYALEWLSADRLRVGLIDGVLTRER